MNTKRLMLITALCFVFSTASFISLAQTDSMTAAGNPSFKTNGSKRFWMGNNYRWEWKTPIRVPVINLATEYGGLTPTKRGGGKQTKNLRLEDPQGREYSLRSIEKFITAKTLPGQFESEAAADLVADGVSASYPYANASVPVLANAAKIPSGTIRLVYIPDDPKLGEFREEFKNMLAILEIRRPDSVKKDYDTEEVVEKLRDDNDNEVDQRGMLKARILDMYVMDLDRHEDQWLWGAVDKDKGKLYYPIPRDRDQAFYINQGLIPGIAKWPWLVPQLQGFRAQAKNIKRFNWAARNVDRFFLNELNEQDWKQAVDLFVSQMTDDVIQKALDQQPNEIKHLRWNEIIEKLKARRQYLAGEVMQYYRFLSENVDVVTSDKKELFDITLNDDASVLVQVYKITNEGEQSTKIYERLFDPNVTKEIRLYAMGGDDKFTLKGSRDKIKIRMIGGEGVDEFVNTTNSGETGIVYDMESEGNKLSGQLKDKMRNDTLANFYDRLGYKYNNVIPFVNLGYNKDDGLFVGASIKVISHGFRKTPYKNLHEFAVNTAFSTNAWNFRYYAEFISTFGHKSDILFEADIKAPNNTTNFFGYGNSVYNKSSPGKFRFYRARYELGDISLLLRKRFSEKVIATIGPTFQFYKMDPNESLNKTRNIVLNAPFTDLDPNTLFAKQSYVGGKFSLNVDLRDNPIIPQRGINWVTTLRHLSGLNDASYEVTQLNSDFTFYLSVVPKWIVFANRFGGGHNFGDFEFYQAQYLGNEANLRGYRKYRFAGRSKLYNNAEVRIRVANFKTYLFPGALGIIGFYDTGRIWSDINETDKWFSGYGGGLWFAPLRRLVITFTYAASKEDKLPLVGLGWKF